MRIRLIPSQTRLDKHWSDQDAVYNFNSELTGTGGASICMWCCARYGQKRKTCAHLIAFDCIRPGPSTEGGEWGRMPQKWVTRRKIPPTPWDNNIKWHFKILHMNYGQLILRKIIKFVATRCQILRLKCTKLDFDWGSPRPRWGCWQRSPRPHSWINGPYF